MYTPPLPNPSLHNPLLQCSIKNGMFIPCEVKGEWNYSKRTSTFVVENVEEIEVKFQDFEIWPLY